MPPRTSKTNQVAAVLEKEIVSGVFQPGERLPSMRTLGKHFKVSTMVLTQAADLLEKKGLVKRSPRSGLYIPESLKKKIMKIGVITDIRPNQMDFYYEGLMSGVSSINGVMIPVSLQGKHDIRNLLAQKPDRIYVDLPGTGKSLAYLQDMLQNVPYLFFNRFQWEAPLPENAILVDYSGSVADAIRYLHAKGHRKIVFLSHLVEPLPFIVRQLKKAAKETGVRCDTPEFSFCSRCDFECAPNRIERIFKKEKPTAIIAHGDYILFEFMSKITALYPHYKDMERIGFYNTMWSRIPGCEFSTFDIQWDKVWEKALKKSEPGIEWVKPVLMDRSEK